MVESVKEILARLSGASHRGGAFGSDVLIAIAEVLPEGPLVSVETGCGKSTIMFSNLSIRHFVFTYDDRDAPESSVAMVQSDPEFKSENTIFVYGPTQRTLPHYQFPDGTMFDVILIDGPHGYPFPDLEYAMLYERLKPGGILILDDVHIASIGNMYDVLREDRMYDDMGVISTTGLLRRSTLAGVPAEGDHWYEQGYNVGRFPQSMAKYRHDRGVTLGRTVDLSVADAVSLYGLKGVEKAKDGSGAQTIDHSAAFEFDLPAGDFPAITLDLSYRTNYPGAAAGATIMIGEQSWPLIYQKSWGTMSIEVERPASGRVRVSVLHPNAETNHSRGVSRYDFRRFGALIRSVQLGVPAALGKGGSPGVGGQGLAWRLRNLLNR